MLYAKSDPEESIFFHMTCLLQELEVLKNIYSNQINSDQISNEKLWELLELACKYHDAGKCYTPFQNKILKYIGKQQIPTGFNYEQLKHEQLSPLFLPEKSLSKAEKKLLYQAIFYHHERNSVNISHNLIEEVIKEDILPRIDELQEELKIEINKTPDALYLGEVNGTKRITEENTYYIDYCLLKGLLHRLDYAASAHVPVEIEANQTIDELTTKFMGQKDFKLNELQEFAKKNQEKNLVVIGSTGMGKTEAALLWSKNAKTFFTLPIRISINAIYDRIKQQINYQDVGLLHSTAIDYLEQTEEYKVSDRIYKLSKNFCSKFIVCTVDQIFPFVFKYRGYERVYATMSYSKVIIDEIQAYSPHMVAIMIKGLEMIYKIGGKFMIMTATLPRIYKEELEKRGIPFSFQTFTKDTKRHKIKIEDKAIEDDLQEIIKSSKDKKVLIIVNTVDKAIEIYQKLIEEKAENVQLLHSRFIAKDRECKEQQIKEFSKKLDNRGIWITTQIVEASLDIDFDMLYTEFSTLDSLFQRFGRCYRSREYSEENPNVYIYKKASGIGYVYNEEIYQKSINLLEKHDETFLLEKTKVNLVDKLYSKEMLKDTKFLEDFKKSIRVLDNIVDYETSKTEAGEIFRQIESVKVIPKRIYDEQLDLLENYEKCRIKEERRKIRRELEKYTTTISKRKERCLKQYISQIGYGIEDIFVIDLEYDPNAGLILKENSQYNLESRIF